MNAFHRSTLAIALAVLNGGCAPEPPPFDVILISIDTLRADRLGAYGYPRETSPTLDALASEGVLFERVIAECSWTLPSHATMFSGLYPSTHAVVKPAARIGPDTPLLAEILRDVGYATIGLTDGGYVGAAHGFDRGFDVYDEREDTFAETVTDALARLNALDEGRRAFLFLHTYDVHCPYDPSQGYASLFRTEGARAIETAGKCGNPHYNTDVLRQGQAEFISDQYDRSIREMDDALASLVDGLREAGRLEHTIVVVTSDHGEELREHGRYGHERSLYIETLQIPLVVLAPGLEPARVAGPVGLTDVMPTILSMLGLAAPAGTEGRALVARSSEGAWRREPLGALARHSELDRHVSLRSVVHGDDHLIQARAGERVELYSLANDPLEAVDRSSREPDVARALVDSIDRHERARRPRTVEMVPSLSDEQRARLRSLGYIN